MVVKKYNGFLLGDLTPESIKEWREARDFDYRNVELPKKENKEIPLADELNYSIVSKPGRNIHRFRRELKARDCLGREITAFAYDIEEPVEEDYTTVSSSPATLRVDDVKYKLSADMVNKLIESGLVSAEEIEQKLKIKPDKSKEAIDPDLHSVLNNRLPNDEGWVVEFIKLIDPMLRWKRYYGEELMKCL